MGPSTFIYLVASALSFIGMLCIVLSMFENDIYINDDMDYEPTTISYHDKYNDDTFSVNLEDELIINNNYELNEL